MFNSPLEKAKILNNGTLSMNQTATIDSWGAIGAKKIMYICAPLAKNGEPALHKCYQTILAEAVKAQAHKILVPSFSTGVEGFTCDKAACIALAEITKFLAVHKDREVHIVTYSKGQEKDETNCQVYTSLFKYVTMNRLKRVEGEIQKMPADLIVVPVGMNFTCPGAVAKAVDQAAHVCVSSSASNLCAPIAPPPHISILGMLPSDVFPKIFSFLPIKTLGNLSSVCKAFFDLQSHPFIWQKKADEFNFSIVTTKDIKQQIKDGIINLEYGSVNLIDKSLKINITKIEFDGLNFKLKDDFIKKALSYFPKGYFVQYFFGYGSWRFAYRDEKGDIKLDCTAGRMGMGPGPGDHILENLTEKEKEIPIIYPVSENKNI